MGKSFFGSVVATLAYINWVQSLSIAALVITILSGAATLAYTIIKIVDYLKDKRRAKKAQQFYKKVS
jgi:hypothetical protein